MWEILRSLRKKGSWHLSLQQTTHLCSHTQIHINILEKADTIQVLYSRHQLSCGNVCPKANLNVKTLQKMPVLIMHYRHDLGKVWFNDLCYPWLQSTFFSRDIISGLLCFFPCTLYWDWKHLANSLFQQLLMLPSSHILHKIKNSS